MLDHLPRRHRAALALALFLVAVVAGTWASTLVGDDHPEAWGVGVGLLTGAVLAAVVYAKRAGSPAPSRTISG